MRKGIRTRESAKDPSAIAQAKISLTLYGTFFYNSIYAVFTLILGILHKSSWYISIAAYYISLAIMRFSLLRYFRISKAGEDVISELKRFRLCGIVLLIMNTALSGLTFYQTIASKELKHHGATAVVLALFTISLFSLSIINVIRYKKFNSPVLYAARLISFVSALVSMLSLETAIISRFETALSDGWQRAITGLSAFAVLAIITYIGIFMVVRSNKALKKLNTSEIKK